METMSKKPMPTPEQRPDLYDSYDGGGLFRETGIATPPHIQKIIDERKAKSATRDSKL